MAPDEQSDPEKAIERDTENLEQDLDRLGDHIDEAKSQAAQRAKEADPTEGGEADVAGDWEDEAPDQPAGDDPSGAGKETTG
jgi:hypothetical protein